MLKSQVSITTKAHEEPRFKHQRSRDTQRLQHSRSKLSFFRKLMKHLEHEAQSSALKPKSTGKKERAKSLTDNGTS